MAQIMRYILNMVPFMLGSLPFVFVFRALRINKMKKLNIKTTVLHEIGVIIFVLFLIALASQTIIPKMQFTNGRLEIIGAMQGKINLLPFKVLVDTYKEIFVYGNIRNFIIYFIGNIVMFIPIGFFIPLLWNKISFKKIMLIAFSVPLFIEICQLPQARIVDIDDVWLNALGVLSGYFLFLIISKLKPKFSIKFKISFL